jgi:hypothetical protein
MGKYEKLLLEIVRGKSDANIEFEELCQIFEGWALRSGYAAVIISLKETASKRRLICSEISARQRSTKFAK